MHRICSAEKGEIGNLREVIEEYRCGNHSMLSFLNGGWDDFEQWKSCARQKVFDHLGSQPQISPMNPRTLSKKDCGSYFREEIEFQVTSSHSTRGTLLFPSGTTRRNPTVIALHDHGGFYYYGREKILETENEPVVLRSFKDLAYGGRSWATELARRGFVVFCIDAFYFGSRRLQMESVSDAVLQRMPCSLEGLRPGTDVFIERYNRNCFFHESLMVKHIETSGATWPGILLHDDRKCIDYLLTRDEVDPNRIGCCGLSIGGLRSAFLAAMDPRISCSVVSGWMTTYGSLLRDKLKDHTFMIRIPDLTRYLDLPDIMCLTAPNPLFVQQCRKDDLFDAEGMQQACDSIAWTYKKIDRAERFKYRFYDNHHEFNAGMQEDAFDWFDRWLK